MAEVFAKLSFSGGLLDPELLGQVDLEKYSLALRESTNWTIQVGGGAATRDSMLFADYLAEPDKAVRLYNFRFNKQIGNTYLLVFQDFKLRFVQSSAYVLEAAQTILSNTPDTIRVIAHGYVAGDWVKLTGFGDDALNTYSVLVVDADNIRLVPISASTLALAGPLGTVARVYTLVTPWQESQLDDLSFSQDKDTVLITHRFYNPQTLSRMAHNSWTLVAQAFGSTAVGPATLTLTPSAAGTAGVVYAVTAVMADGQESPIRAINLTETTVNITATAGTMKVTWTPVSGAIGYKVYRSLYTVTGVDITFAELLGFVGSTIGTQFIDNNVVPDFSKQPSAAYSPFDSGTITSISVTAPGAGYNKLTSTVTAAGGATFSGRPIVNNVGAIIGVIILNPGRSFTSPVFTFGGPGAGATATGTVSPVSGNNPGCSTKIQQRQVYSGQTNFPMTLYGSKTGYPFDLGSSALPTASEGFNFTLDAEEVTPIKTMLSFSTGLMLFTESSIWQVTGAADELITASSARAELVYASGAANLHPLVIDNSVIFLAETYNSVNSLKQGRVAGKLDAFSLSTFSRHLFTPGERIESWAYAANPNKLIWGQRRDGRMVTCTYVPEQNVYAWSLHETRGECVALAVVRERLFDRPYFAVKRRISGTDYLFLETLATRRLENPDFFWSLDAAVATALPKPAAGLKAADTTGLGVKLTADTAIFTVADVGKHWRGGGGRALVTTYLHPKAILVDFEYPISELRPGTLEPVDFENGSWSLTAKFTTFGGLHHLNGRNVAVVGDGGVYTEIPVVNGSITLPDLVSYAAAGLQFDARLRTLPFSSTAALVEHKVKRLVRSHVRLHLSRGLWVGDDHGQYEMKERTYEALTVPINPQTGLYDTIIASDWDADVGLVAEKRLPLHATVLAFFVEVEIGDD